MKHRPIQVPVCVLQGTYSTHGEPRRRDLGAALGYVVDLEFAHFAKIESGRGFEGLRIFCAPETSVDLNKMGDGSVIIRVKPSLRAIRANRLLRECGNE